MPPELRDSFTEVNSTIHEGWMWGESQNTKPYLTMISLEGRGDNMQEIKKVGVLSFAKIEAALGAIIGFILGLIWAIIGTAFMGFANMAGATMPSGFSIMFGLAAIIVVPILYAIIGFIAGLIVAFLYNLVAGWIGGIEVELV
jgi:hypothetical protein